MSAPAGRRDDGGRRRERGVVLAESAWSILAFVVFVFGVLEAGRLMSVQNTLANAAREGARFAVLPAKGTSTLPDAAQVEERVALFLQANAIPSASATVGVATETVGTTTFTRVTVSAPYAPMLSFFGVLEGTLSGTSRMRNETSS